MPMHSFAQLFATWQWSRLYMCRCLYSFEGNSARMLRVTVAILKGYFTNNQTKPLRIPVHISNTASHTPQALTLKKKKRKKEKRKSQQNWFKYIWSQSFVNTVVCTIVAVNVDRAAQKTQKWVHLPQPCKVSLSWGTVIRGLLNIVDAKTWMKNYAWKTRWKKLHKIIS